MGRLAVGEGGVGVVGGDVDVDVLAVRHQGVGVGAAVGLDRGDVLGVALVADVEDADPSQESLMVADWATLLQESSLREESTDRKSRSPLTEMSP